MLRPLLTFLLIVSVYSSKQKGILEAIQNGIQKLNLVEAAPLSLKQAIQNISTIKNKTEADDTVCKTCKIVLDNLITYRRTGATKESMIIYLNKLCTTFSDWGVVACKGFVDIELETIIYIIDNKRNLTPERFCGIYFQSKKCVDPNAEKWTIDIPPLPEFSNESDVTGIEENPSPLRILHLTDFHYDPLYKPESNSDCGMPLCCQNGIPSDPKNAAGYWGDYNVCDMPLHSVHDVLAHIKEKHLKHIDFIYYTGDIISHKSWSSSKAENTETFKKIFQLFAHTFKNKTIYPILGNHEPHPTDNYSPNEIKQNPISMHWMFDLSVTEWSRWLPDDTHTTIRLGGYYSVLVKPGFRIIALNSNVCFIHNLWLIYQDKDPYYQLKWLVKELYKAEKNKEKVHILSHIPPGDVDCHKQWSNQFRKIINRFASTISAQFNGHTHIDEFRVFYHPDDPNRVINVAYNGGSFTTFIGYNPNYRIYQVDPLNHEVLDYDQYTYNLTHANKNKNSPEWYKLYSFKGAYNLPNMKFDSIRNLLSRMSNDKDLMWQYFKFQVRNSDRAIQAGCDNTCLKQLQCYITAVEAQDTVNC